MNEDTISIKVGDRFTDTTNSKYIHVIRTYPYFVCEEYTEPIKIPESRKVIIFKNLNEFINGGWVYLDRNANIEHIGIDFVPQPDNPIDKQIYGYWQSIKSYLNEIAISDKQPKKYQRFLFGSLYKMSKELDSLFEGNNK